jgi:hypothetical protein
LAAALACRQVVVTTTADAEIQRWRLAENFRERFGTQLRLLEAT